MSVQAHDIMDTAEVAAALGVAVASVQVALSRPAVNPALARRLPPPLRKVGNVWVWTRESVEAVIVSDPCDPHGIPRPVMP
jgi:predicted trehalose synthase